MKKIPTLFVRDYADQGRLLPVINEGCEWALTDPTARATRKWDGTCVMLDDAGRWWARREVRPDREAPAGWQELATDETTGKRVGWEPIEQSSFAKWHAEACDDWGGRVPYLPGTYELVGPKVNGNPEKLNYHALIEHGSGGALPLLVWPDPVPVAETFDALRELLLSLAGVEGIVWHHPDGRMVKLKGKDFR